MTDVQKLVVRVLNEHGGEEHLGENDAPIELHEHMAAQGHHGSGKEAVLQSVDCGRCAIEWSMLMSP